MGTVEPPKAVETNY